MKRSESAPSPSRLLGRLRLDTSVGALASERRIRLLEAIAFNGYGYALAASPEAVLVKEVQPQGMRFLRYRRPPT